ncbi:helix-turn-helix domain-containing protein [Variovorax sp.]|uniref:helix-turn-helix domain-containing protein n=1 Tax=Variovorax sp. TaxID=1871043 RepID=UPI002D394DD6|nr:helix-turn-helix domain-containing protein [Variovorax sp.]HYP81827.1 helix-turn-helix domain-containing protein [Variovorax sp.]
MTDDDEAMTPDDKAGLTPGGLGWKLSVHDAVFPVLPLAGILTIAQEQNWNIAELFPSLSAQDGLPDARYSYAEAREGILRSLYRARGLQLAVNSGARKALPHLGAIGPGFAAHRTLGEALRFGLSYQLVAGSMLDLRFHEDGRECWLAAHSRFDDPELRDFLDIDHLATVANALRQLQPHGPPLFNRVELSCVAPSLRDSLADLFGANVTFGHPISRLVFQPGALDRPQLLYSALGIELARQACERDLAMRSLTLQRAGTLRKRLYDASGRLLPLSRVADDLDMSPRNLQRALAREGLRYSDLLDEQRREEAQRLLHAGHSTAQVAEKLEFSDQRSFVRAFERWTGLSPAAWRKSQQIG